VFCVCLLSLLCVFFVFIFVFIFVFFSVLWYWYCWLGLLTCKTVAQITYKLTVLVKTLNPAHCLFVCASRPVRLCIQPLMKQMRWVADGCSSSEDTTGDKSSCQPAYDEASHTNVIARNSRICMRMRHLCDGSCSGWETATSPALCCAAASGSNWRRRS